jgi:uncharacterized Fe-S cluster-containing protein
MDTLNAMTRELGLNDDLKLRLRDYFRYRHLGTNMDDWHTMLELMVGLVATFVRRRRSFSRSEYSFGYFFHLICSQNTS